LGSGERRCRTKARTDWAKNPAQTTGRTRCNKIVVFDGSERQRGQLMDLKITRAGSFTLYGNPAIVNW
jgi:tRNA-2-methylthio-N6-dimethylallyladenosine synthase